MGKFAIAIYEDLYEIFYDIYVVNNFVWLDSIITNKKQAFQEANNLNLFEHFLR